MGEENKKQEPEVKAEVRLEPKIEPAPQAAQAAPEQKKGAAETKKVEKPKSEKPANCAGCNKSIKKKRWYYRNGKFYCTKRCWKAASKKVEKPKTPQGQEAPR